MDHMALHREGGIADAKSVTRKAVRLRKQIRTLPGFVVNCGFSTIIFG